MCVLLFFFLTFSALVASPRKTTLHGGQSRSWSAEQGKKKKKKKSGSAPPPPPPVCVCVCVCVVIPFILDVRLVDVPAGITQEEGHTGFLHLLSGVLALIFIARRIQPSLSLVDHEVQFCVPTN